MQLDPKWEALFSSTILSRGFDYYLKDSVCNLRAGESGWTATVHGGDTYSVFVPNTDNGALEPHCDCPHFAGGNLCKHLAATCFEIEHRIQEGDPCDSAPEAQADQHSNVPSLEDLVRSVDEADVRDFLLAALHESESLRRRFMGKFAEPNIQRLRYDLGRDIEQTARSFGHRGFIDYRSAYSFSLELVDIVGANIDPLIERGALWEAFELTTLVVLKIQEIQIDDSDGFFSSMMDLCTDYWRVILASADPATKRRVFDWFSQFSLVNPGRDEADIYWFEEDCVEEFLVSTFAAEPAFSHDVQAIANRHIAESQAGLQADLDISPLFTRSYQLNLERWTLVRLKTMQVLDATADELLTFAELMMDYPKVRTFFVDDALARNDVHRAIELLEEGKSQAESTDCYPVEESRQLLTLYQQIHDRERTKRELFDLAVHDVPRNKEQGVPWLRQLRQLYDPNAWQTVRERIFSSMDDDRAVRSYLADEGLTARLKASIESLDELSRFYEIQRFTDKLKADYPAWLLSEYQAAVEEMLLRTTGRSVYQSAAATLRKMQDIRGGKALVSKMVESFKARYPRRRILMEELGKL